MSKDMWKVVCPFSGVEFEGFSVPGNSSQVFGPFDLVSYGTRGVQIMVNGFIRQGFDNIKTAADTGQLSKFATPSGATAVLSGSLKRMKYQVFAIFPTLKMKDLMKEHGAGTFITSVVTTAFVTSWGNSMLLAAKAKNFPIGSISAASQRTMIPNFFANFFPWSMICSDTQPAYKLIGGATAGLIASFPETISNKAMMEIDKGVVNALTSAIKQFSFLEALKIAPTRAAGSAATVMILSDDVRKAIYDIIAEFMTSRESERVTPQSSDENILDIAEIDVFLTPEEAAAKKFQDFIEEFNEYSKAKLEASLLKCTPEEKKRFKEMKDDLQTPSKVPESPKVEVVIDKDKPHSELRS